MKIYYPTRDNARQSKGKSGKVIDCKKMPSKKGYRWAVEYQITK